MSTVNELGKTTTYNYDNVTKLLTYVQNANNVHTAYVYDNRDRTTKVYLDSDKDGVPDTAEAQVAYLYANNRLSGIDTASTDYTLTYDAFGNVLTIKAGNYVLATYEYAGNNGKLKKLTYGNGDYEEYVYDILDRLVSVKLNGATEYVVKYDSNGRLYSLTESGSTHIYEYDSLDRLIRAWQENASGTKVLEVENSYDDLGRAKGSTYVVNGREMSYGITYKTDSNLVASMSMPYAVKGSLMSSLIYAYDEFERLTTKEISLSTMATLYEDYAYYSYTDANDVEHATSLVSSVTLRGSTPHTTSAVYTYTYDNLGNIKSISKNGTQIAYYSYDSLGQLISEQDCVNDTLYNYTYDKSGNITKKTVFDNITSESQTIATYTYGNSSWGDMLTAYNGTAITYDAIGNPLKWRNATNLSWNGRELQSISLSGGSSTSYSYNSDGIRTQKVYNNAANQSTAIHFYTLDGTRIIRERVVSAAGSVPTYDLYYLYDASGNVVGFIYNNSYYYYRKNLQGDVVSILNSSGSVVVEYTYDAWGKVLSTTGSLASTLGQYNPFRYRSYYYDVETGFYYLQSRYYDPTVGRFINADAYVSTGQGFTGNNMFAYCLNNPVNFLDYNGLFADDIFEGVTQWLEMIFNHDWGAVHRAVQRDICRKNSGMMHETPAVNGGRIDLYFPATDEVWEIKSGASSIAGIAAAYLSLIEYLVPDDEKVIGSAGRFTGTLDNVDIGANFNYYYNIDYYTPLPGVVLYTFQRGDKKNNSIESKSVIVPPTEKQKNGKSNSASLGINNHVIPDGNRSPGLGGGLAFLGICCVSLARAVTHNR